MAIGGEVLSQPAVRASVDRALTLGSAGYDPRCLRALPHPVHAVIPARHRPFIISQKPVLRHGYGHACRPAMEMRIHYPSLQEKNWPVTPTLTSPSQYRAY